MNVHIQLKYEHILKTPTFIPLIGYKKPQLNGGFYVRQLRLSDQKRLFPTEFQPQSMPLHHCHCDQNLQPKHLFLEVKSA